METLHILADQQQSLRDFIKSVAKPLSKAVVDQISSSDPKPGTSQQRDLRIHLSCKPLDEPMETAFVGPALPPQFVQRFESEIPSEGNLEPSESFAATKLKKHWDKRKPKFQVNVLLHLQAGGYQSEISVQVKKSSKPKGDSSENISHTLTQTSFLTGK